MRLKRGRGAIIAVVLVALVVFAAMYTTWNTLSQIFLPPSTSSNQSISLVIQPNESVQAIANDLYTKGLIKNTEAFVLWARIKGLDTTLEAGVYNLSPNLTIDQIIAHLQNGQPDARQVTVVPGWRLEQIAAAAGSVGLAHFSTSDFLNYTHNPGKFPDEGKYTLLLQGAPNMEGLLYPDTYLVPVNYNTVQVIDLMLQEMTQVVQQNNFAAQAKQHGLSLYQMLTLASIVQREASNNGQMKLIAGIYWNRIEVPSSDVGGPYLKSDPTVEYAYYTDHPPSNGDYWGDLNNLGTGGEVDPNNPWNTYTHPGWPPSPISTASMFAFQAAADPAQTKCYYFFTKPSDGSLVCEPTYAQIVADEQKDGLN